MRKHWMKWMTVVMIVVFLLGMVGYAKTEIILEEEIPMQTHCGLLQIATEIPMPDGKTDGALRLSHGQTPTLFETLEVGCRAQEEFIDVMQYGISVTDMRDLFYNFSMLHPELLVATSYSFVRESSVNPFGDYNKIAYLAPTYLCSLEELPAKQQAFSNYVSSYAAEASQYSTPLEQLLFLHDKLVIDTTYCTDAANKATSNTLTDEDYLYFHAYGLFTQGTVVCQGYAQAFFAIAKELGFEVNYCYNSGHIWNYIKLDGEWYHLDATWDDPVPDQAGLTRHAYFLRSDASMDDHAPEEWSSPLDTLPVCDGTEYESGYIFNVSNGKVITKEANGYRMTCWNMDFFSDSLWTGTVLTTAPENGKVRYIYMEEPETPIAIYTARKDSENILRGGGVAIRTGESQYNSNGSLSLYSYTLPTGPATATSGTVYFRDGARQKPVGPTLHF